MALPIVSLIFLLLCAVSLSSPKRGLLITVFLAPWMGLDIDVGLRMTGYRLSLVALVVALAIRAIVKHTNGRNRPISKSLLFFMFYAVTISIYQLINLPSMSVEGGVLRSGIIRPMAQIIMLIITVSPIVIIPQIITRQQDIQNCGKIFIKSLLILSFIGLIQLAIWYATGTDPIPIGYLQSLFTGSSESLRSGIDYIGSIPVYRMSSFGGEPKGLAQGLAVGLLMLQSLFLINYKLKNRIVNNRKIVTLWIFFFLSMILTWSTSGVFLWLIGTLFMFVIINLIFKNARRSNSMLIGSLLLVSFFIGFSLIFSESSVNSNIASEFVSKRFIERGPIEDFDETVITFLKNQPQFLLTGVGLGNVHVYASKYIPSYAQYYMKNNIFVAKSGYLRIISELGILGFTLFLLLSWNILEPLRRMAVRLKRQGYFDLTLSTLYLLGITSVVGGMARTYIWPEMFLILGICASYPYLLPRTNRNLHLHNRVIHSAKTDTRIIAHSGFH